VNARTTLGINPRDTKKRTQRREKMLKKAVQASKIVRGKRKVDLRNDGIILVGSKDELNKNEENTAKNKRLASRPSTSQNRGSGFGTVWDIHHQQGTRNSENSEQKPHHVIHIDYEKERQDKNGNGDHGGKNHAARAERNIDQGVNEHYDRNNERKVNAEPLRTAFVAHILIH
jgi:hypothetical protein